MAQPNPTPRLFDLARLPTNFTFERLVATCRKRGRSRSSHYRDIQLGLFTQPVLLSQRSVGWPSYETDLINAARIAGKADDEIRTLVIELHAKRKTLAGGA